MTPRDWGLGSKQRLGFGLVLLLMAGVHFYSIHSMRQIRVELDEVSGNWLPRALAISDVNLNTSRLRIHQLRQALVVDAAARRDLAAASIGFIDAINAGLDDYRELRDASRRHDRFSDEERRHYEVFDAAWESYQDLSLTFYALLDDGDTEAAVALLNGEGQAVFGGLTAALEQLVTVNHLESLQAADRAAGTFTSARGVSFSLLLLTFGLAALASVGLVRWITRPITQLERASREVARGDLDVSIEVRSGDEIGSLAHSFNDMTGALRQAHAERERQAAQLRTQNEELAAALKELETTQQQLLLREKMASLGDLVAGVTHELNTPIGAARSAADVAGRCLQRLEAAVERSADGGAFDETQRVEARRALRILRDNLGNADVATARILTIVESLRNFARLDEAELQRADLHEGLESTLTLMHAELVGRVRVARDYGQLPSVICYPGQLNQVFRIVLKNAAEAIDGDGMITVRTELAGERIRITVTDTGRGIPEDRLPRLFDFGFSAAGPRVRLTSGLPTAYSIMQRHRGDIRLDSQPGVGTTVTLELPTG